MSIERGGNVVPGVLSDCCGAEVVYHDICTACKEHCDTQQETEEGK